MLKTWLIVGLIISLVLNAFFIGFIMSKHPLRSPFPKAPFPPLPPMIRPEKVPGLRAHFFKSKESSHKHLRDLREELVMEMASDSTSHVRVDSLMEAIVAEQRSLQESVINYIDSLKSSVSMEDRLQLHRWILDCFGADEHMRHRFRGPECPESLPPPAECPRKAK
jgi:hypothetical protein